MTLVGIMLIITGTLLFLTKILKPKILKYLKFMHYYWIISGICCYTWNFKIWSHNLHLTFLGNNKSEAAKFSFLIVIPVIFGAILKDVLSGIFLTMKSNFNTNNWVYIFIFNWSFGM